MIGDEKNFGKRISPQLSEYLKEHTTVQDRMDAAEKSGVSHSTLRDVVYRSNNLAETNWKAVEELMKTAIKNCQDKKHSAERARKYIQTQIA